MRQQQIEIGQMVFVADGEMGIGAVRDVRDSDIVVNIQNTGDVVLPLSAIKAVHSGKVVLDLQQLDPELLEALRHVHDAELPGYAVMDRREGTPDALSRRH